MQQGSLYQRKNQANKNLAVKFDNDCKQARPAQGNAIDCSQFCAHLPIQSSLPASRFIWEKANAVRIVPKPSDFGRHN